MSDLKDSGSYWLGEIPEDWEMLPAWALFTEGKEKCGADDPHLVPSRVYGVVTRDDLTELSGNKPVDNEASAHNMKHVNPHDFIISMGSHESGIEHSRLVGKVSNDYRVLRPTNDVNPEYYKWFFKSAPLIEGLRGLTTEIRVGQRIHYSRFSLLRLPIPSAADQQRIADYLDRETAEIDAAVADLDRYVGLLEKRLAHFVSESLDKDSFPAVPVFTLAALSAGAGITAESIEDSGTYPVYGGNGLRGYTETFNQSVDRILIGRQGALCGNVHYAPGPLFASEHALVVNPRASFNLVWLEHALRDLNLRTLSQASAQPGISASEVSRQRVHLPPREKQDAIAQLISNEVKQTHQIIEESIKLRNLLLKRRSVLITEVVTGRKQV